MINTATAAVLRDARKRAGLTQHDIAQAIGRSLRHVQRIETAQGDAEASVRDLARWADACDHKLWRIGSMIDRIIDADPQPESVGAAVALLAEPLNPLRHRRG